MVAGLVLLSIVAFFSIIIGTATGVDDLSEGFWPALYVTVYLALPIAILLMITLVIVSARIRAKEARAARNVSPAQSGKPSTRATTTPSRPAASRPGATPGRTTSKGRKNPPRTNRAG